jgi:tetratricopeptide (TPR) repeat protein
MMTQPPATRQRKIDVVTLIAVSVILAAVGMLSLVLFALYLFVIPAIQKDNYLTQGNRLYYRSDYDGAIAEYRKALKIDPKYAVAHYDIGLALDAQGKTKEAIAAYRRAIRFDPKYADAHYALGLALSDVGKLDEAIATFRKGIKLDPKDARFHQALGTALHEKGKPNEAIASFQRALKLDPKL